MSNPKRIHLRYEVATDPTDPNTTAAILHHTGLDPDNPDHRKAIEPLIQSFLIEVYCAVHGIELDGITLEKDHNPKP